MIMFKKFFGDELLQLAIILSLLRVDPDSYFNLNPLNEIEHQEIILGSSSAYTQTRFHNLNNRLNGYIHPKNVESMILDHESVFYELNSLGRYSRYYEVNQEITTYLLNDQERTSNTNNEESPSEPSANTNEPREESNDNPEVSIEGATSTSTISLVPIGGELTKEDMDLIEVLLKQDIDLGVTRDVFDVQLRKELEKVDETSKEDIKKEEPETSDCRNNPWAGLNYTIDSETGEHVVLPENSGENFTGDISPISPPINDFLSLTDELQIPLDEALNLEDLEETGNEQESEIRSSPLLGEDLLIRSTSSSPPPGENTSSLAEQLEELEEIMIQTAQLHVHPHGRPLQARMPYLRTISMEQRWQDIANILSLPLNPEADIHNFHAVHPSTHNFTTPTSIGYGGIDNRSSILLHNATLPPPVADINSNMSYHNDIADGSNLATAVATSVTQLSALTNSSEPMNDAGIPSSNYGVDSGAIMFPHNHTEINQTTEGFLSSILLDEDLQLMDMAMNDVPYTPNERYVQQPQPITGMYSMKTLENEDAMDTSSDSAVSSMGSSERVPSISDGEWMETGSDSSRPAADQEHYYGLNYSHNSTIPNKYRPYDYSYPVVHPPRPPVPNTTETGLSSIDRRIPPVAQKKYQLFGKRFPTEQVLGNPYNNNGRSHNIPQPPNIMKYTEYPYERNHSDRNGRSPFETSPDGATAIEPAEQKFSCSMEFVRQHSSERAILEHVQHNHTYQLPPESFSNSQRPTVRDKQRKKTLEEHISRDEKRARALKIPLTAEEIINLPMDEFNERLSKFDLTEAQLALIRDIRRRGKNKVAAQNCRKRKLDQILTLAEVVQKMQEEREELQQEHQTVLMQRKRMQDKFAHLYRHVFQALRDPDGNPYSPYEYSLQQAADGNILLVPRNNSTSIELDPNKGAKAKKKDDSKK